MEQFIQRTAKAWGVSEFDATRLLNTQYATIIRVNPLKVRKSTLSNIKKNFKTVHKIEWAENTYTVANGKVKVSDLPEFANGEVIIQNAASFIPVLELKPAADESIIDICAAPGGKSSHLAALSGNKAYLTLNDTSRTRFFKMKKLMSTMGVLAEYSLRDGRYLSKEYGHNSFDKILLDAPCSGEANIKDGSMHEWSFSTIKRLSSLQAKLLQDAYHMLKPGGRLVYSTCTIAPEENEVVIDGLLRHNPSADIIQCSPYPIDSLEGITEWNSKKLDMRIKGCLRLLPSEVCKPFFIAVITKKDLGADDDDSYMRAEKAFGQRTSV